MRRSPRAVVLALALSAAAAATAGLDPTAGTRLEGATIARQDIRVRLDEVTVLTDQDDGDNGKSEYCLRVSAESTDPKLAHSESLDCVGASWRKDISRSSGQTWKEERRLPLIGVEGYVGSNWVWRHTANCSRYEFWKLTVQLSEMDDIGPFDVINRVQKAVSNLAGLSVIVPGKIGVAGLAVGAFATAFDGILKNKHDDLGIIEADWPTGVGGPARHVGRTPPPARHFRIRAEMILGVPCARRSAVQNVQHPLVRAVARSGSGSACGSDAHHIFCVNVDKARQSWKRLGQAADLINAVRNERGSAPSLLRVNRTRTALIKLVAGVAELATKTEVKDAHLAAFIDPSLVREASAQYRDGLHLASNAVEENSTALLREALRRFESAYEAIVPRLHPRFNRR